MKELSELDRGWNDIVEPELEKKGVSGLASTKQETGRNSPRAFSDPEKPEPHTYRIPTSLHLEVKALHKAYGVPLGQMVAFLLKKGQLHLDEMRTEVMPVVVSKRIIMEE